MCHMNVLTGILIESRLNKVSVCRCFLFIPTSADLTTGWMTINSLSQVFEVSWAYGAVQFLVNDMQPDST